MTTPIIMLVLMMAPYLVVRVLSAVLHRDFDARGAAAIGLGGLFLFTAIGYSFKLNLWPECYLLGSQGRATWFRPILVSNYHLRSPKTLLTRDGGLGPIKSLHLTHL